MIWDAPLRSSNLSLKFKNVFLSISKKKLGLSWYENGDVYNYRVNVV